MKPFGHAGGEHGATGTNAERLALSTSTLVPPFKFVTSDNGIWLWNGSSWIRIDSLIAFRWTGSGIGAAPSATSFPDFVVGVDQDGVASASVYHTIGGNWILTGASVANLYGG